MNVPEPLLKPTPIRELRPTQMTVGFREVATKRHEWRDRTEHDGSDFLGRHMIPIVTGPKKRPYVIDHHHLARALQEEGVELVLTTVVADLGHLEKDAFWVFLDNRNWMHPFDDKGVRRDYADLPKSIAALTDDPYRSLAGALRRAGGFAKDERPFSEFLWADFLRRRIKRSEVDKDFDKALDEALTLSKQPESSYLPGWCAKS
jgi:hypothetical protein